MKKNIITKIGIVGALLVLPFLSLAQANPANTSIVASLGSIKTIADAIYQNEGNFDRVCGSNGKSQDLSIKAYLLNISSQSGGGIVCAKPAVGKSKTYAIYVALKPIKGTSSHYCIDSKGFKGGQNAFIGKNAAACVTTVSKTNSALKAAVFLAQGSPSPTGFGSPSPSPTVSVTPSATATPRPTITPTATPPVTGTPSPTVTATPTNTPTPTPTIYASVVPTPIVTVTQTPIVTPTPSVFPTTIGGRGIYQRTLTVGSKGADVKALQVYLNTNGSTISRTGLGSRGNESDFFGAATKTALSKWQQKNDLPATGIVDASTRAKLNISGMSIYEYSKLKVKTN